MKAIRVHAFGGPEVLQLDEVAIPQAGPGQVQVEVRAIGVNPVETYIRTGTHARKPALPYIPGSDAAGVVTAVGEGVTHVAPGDRVFVASFTTAASSGAYAEHLVADGSLVARLPEAVTFAQGAAVGVPCITAWRALFQKGVARAGETVLVHGASGGVGTAAVQLASASGSIVLATAGSERGRALAAASGAAHVFDHTQAGYLDEIAVHSPPGPDLILEMLANVNLAHDLALVRTGGRVVIVGSRGPIEINPRAIMAKDAVVTGMMLPNTSPPEFAEALAAIVTALANGTLRPVVGREMPLADARAAHEAVLAPGSYGKIVLVP